MSQPTQREYGWYRANLLAMKLGGVTEIQANEQSRYLRAAKEIHMLVATVKTDDGKMLLWRLKIRRIKHKCPRCGEPL